MTAVVTDSANTATADTDRGNTDRARPDTAKTDRAKPAVWLRDVDKRFGDRVILDRVGLQISRGEFVALLGASGSGKTTLLRMLAGLDSADAGQLLVPRARTVVFQEPRLLPAQRVLANVTIGMRGRDVVDTARKALTEVGLAAHERAWPVTLSGGEAQRVALARALVRSPELLLLDEPFAALDALTRLKMQDLVADLCVRHGPAVLLVTHDVDEALRLADRIIVLRDGHFIRDHRGIRAGDGPTRADLLDALGVHAAG
ncbi:ATP-binding cassette domain-containing protein [Microbacterium protaetiae]|uniref:ATP-binding cassette domain-containing protein n=1 Tax=Microbacterium protaetiae TaxID=2509458 RepID=A0A4P6EN98_9MICO|nr:ATP-binding cassette domain-containing protein [Microbacterium protaetiae]QAY59368.1 ATP-binding cassette domain-containing protein [Microbacterium protaetiae]